MHWILYSEETDNDHYQQIADTMDKKIFEGMTFFLTSKLSPEGQETNFAYLGKPPTIDVIESHRIR